MLTVNSISKSYGINNVLYNISFTLNGDEKTALVGPNGCGKTTLLRVLAGEELADGGNFHFSPPSLSIGYLPQGADFPAGQNVGSYLARMQGDLPTLSRELEETAAQLAQHPSHNALQLTYDRLLERIASAGDAAGRAPALLAAFGLDKLPPEQPLTSLSGGQKTRLLLAGVLLSKPRLLLLDEPTNHLDLEMLEWLETWLVHSPCAVLLVSHDRVFLDHVASTILEIDLRTHTLRSYPGNYSAYLAAKELEHQRQLQEYGDQQAEIARLKAAARHMREIADFRKGGKADTGDKFAAGFFANRSLGTTRRRKSLEARLDRLLTDEHIEKPRGEWRMKLDLEGQAESGRDVVILKDLTIGYGQTPILSRLDVVLHFRQRVVLTGPNGSGKTTLLRTIAGELPPLRGTCRLGAGVRPGFMTQEQSELKPDLNALETIQQVANLAQTEARTFLHKYLFGGDEVFTLVKSMSYGQRSRLSLACLAARGCNLLLLDEPLNHLDIPSRQQFEQALGGYNGTILTVTHDRYFINRVATHLWLVSRNGLLSFEAPPHEFPP